MLDYDEISYSEIADCILDAAEGKLSPYWQGYAEHEFDSMRNKDGALPERAGKLYAVYRLILENVTQCEND